MQDKSSMMLRLLLNRFHKGAQDTILKALPEEESQKVLSVPIDSSDIQAALTAPLDMLENVHYSWIVPKLQELPPNTLPFILALMPQPQASKIGEILSIKDSIAPLSSPMKRFILQQLSHLIEFNDTLPVAYIPKTEMTHLAELKKHELVDLIDFMGLYDLSEELHQIVDKKLLENVYQSLTHRKQVYLRQCLRSKEKLVTNRLNLEHWDGDSEKLMKLLHHRGLVRLGYALSGQHRDLVWHITHILDTGRGEKLERYINEKEIPAVTQALREQIHNVIEFFKKVKESE